MDVRVESRKVRMALKELKVMAGYGQVLVEAADKLMLTVTNGRQRCLAFIEAEVIEPGFFVVDIAEFENLSNAFANIVYDGEIVSIGTYDCKPLDCGLEPFVCQEHFEVLTTFDGDMVSKVQHAMSQDNERLHQVLLRAKDGYLVAVACDGYRLAETKVFTLEEFEVLLPAEVASLLMSRELWLGMVDDTVILHSGELQIEFTNSRGSYPDYEKLFKFTPVATVEVGATAFFGGWLNDMDSERSKRICLRGKENGTIFCLGGQSIFFAGEGEGEYEIDLNSQFLYEAVRVIEDEKFTMLIGGEYEPVEIRSTGLRQLIMPMQ